jgi:excinuclease ABC subunit A
MLKSSGRSAIRLRGVRHNNLKNFDLDLPLNQLIVITGLSGSGKSSLAFDTLFAEGQRRYIETFSPYARQFFDRMDKPQVDSIEGIPPAIAIEQRNAVRTTRSTVGTMTEICDYMKMLWPYVAQLQCRQCGQPVRKDSPQQIWETMQRNPRATAAHQRSGNGGTDRTSKIFENQTVKSEVLITFDLPLSEKLSFEESLGLVSKQGYQRLLVDGEIVRLDELLANPKQRAARTLFLTVIQDRLVLAPANRPRFVEACEQAYHFGKGKLAIRDLPLTDHASPGIERFSNRLHCANCDLEYREPSPALFSFNNPVGACPSCRGFGRAISIDYNLALPDRSKTLAEGVVKPWQTGQGAECQTDLLRMCRHFEIPVNVPFERLPKRWQDFVIEGEPDYGKDEEHQWPRAWYGIKGYFRWLESRTYKMHVRVLLARYRAYTTCLVCDGKRFQPDALLYRVEGLTLADFYLLPIRDALPFIESLARKHNSRANDPLGLVLNEVRARLGYLNEVGLGYLTLDRPTRSLSGGETERVNLTTCLGTRLVNTLYVLDEPSVGLHPRDTERLVRILEQLRDTGNTVVVVEHEPSIMRAADQIIDLGPGHGATGGQVVFQGSYREILKSAESLTGKYLSGKKEIEIPPRRIIEQDRALDSNAFVLNDASASLNLGQPGFPSLKISHASQHNLKDLSVEIPLGRFVCVTGVSGSGKTTLIREVLLPTLAARLKSGALEAELADNGRQTGEPNGESDENALPGPGTTALLEGAEHLGRVLLVDQSTLGKTPRSNPAVYIGAFDDIRELFAQSDLAKQRGLDGSAFSFNSSQGQCERCHGAGFEKIEMQFLSDVFIRCPDCNGRRYRPHILELKIRGTAGTGNGSPEVSVPKRNVLTRLAHIPHRSSRGSASRDHASAPLSIADLLDSTIEQAISFLSGFPESRPARRAAQSLKLLEEVGLGYLKLGQPINTLSGGESQRLKLVRHLAEAFIESNASGASPSRVTYHPSGRAQPSADLKDAPTLFLFDEPTTGLHFEDVRGLLKVFQRIVEAGHSVVVIEHNLEVIKCADWLIDLGPDAGDQGGQIVAQGTPEQVAACPSSHTGKALREVLGKVRKVPVERC